MTWWIAATHTAHCPHVRGTKKEFGTLCPMLQFVVHRGYCRFNGCVPLREWAQSSAVRTQPLAHHRTAWQKRCWCQAVTSSCVILLKDEQRNFPLLPGGEGRSAGGEEEIWITLTEKRFTGSSRWQMHLYCFYSDSTQKIPHATWTSDCAFMVILKAQ